MLKSNRSSRRVISRIALFTGIASFPLIFMAAGTSAAGASFIDTVKDLFGMPSARSAGASPSSIMKSTSRKKVLPNDLPLGVYGTSWLRLKETSQIKTAQEPRDPKPLGKKASVRTSSPAHKPGMTVGQSYHNDTSPALRDMRQLPMRPRLDEESDERGPNPNPSNPDNHTDSVDPVVQSDMAPDVMPTPIRNFIGINFPGVSCNCSPPDTNGEVGATQYVQMVNAGYQVFNKTTGASILGPSSIVSLWAGFGGACETGGFGDPIVLYDQIANRWLISQFASATGNVPTTDQCIAVSQTSDATGAYNRYGYHLGSNFFDYPHLGVWPDGYYMADNVFNAGGTARLGPQAFVFDRVAMLAGLPAAFITPGITGGPGEGYFLPADLDGLTLPPVGTACPFVEWPGTTGTYKTLLFHADFIVPANSTFTQRTSPNAAGFASLCPSTRACVPEIVGAGQLDEVGDRLMFRLPYRIIDGVERIVGNYTVSSSSVAGIRWFELRNVTSGAESVFQESTYQPDTDWRWMGSVAQDQAGNMALGFSASSLTINPQVRYAGRLVTDTINTLGQGEAHLFDGTSSQTGNNRWGDYSDMTVDPVDDCTFWYTQEYVGIGGNWRTRIGSFKFAACGSIGTPTPTSTPTNTATATATATPAAVISGTVTYGNAVSGPTPPRPVSSVTISGAGSPNVSTTTSFPDGTYSLSGFGAGAYVVTPTKTGGVNGITSFDAARIAQHVAGVSPLTGNQLIVADVSGNGSISSFDSAQVAGFVVSTPPFGSTGTWRFAPVNRTYASITNNVTGQDYSALLMGEVSGNWANSAARTAIGPERNTSVSAPRLVTPADAEVLIPVSVEGTADKGIIAYEFDLRYDPSVIRPQANPVDLTGTLSSKLSVAASAEEAGLLKVAVYGPMPLEGNGVLLNLRFTAVGAPGSVSPLTWERIMLNEDETTAADGQVELSAAAPNQAEISGRLLTAMGQGVPHARVTLTDMAGQTRFALSNGFGVYRFGSLQVGQTYTIRVESRGYAFTPLTVSVSGQLASVDMIAGQ